MDNNTYNDDNTCIICLEESGELLDNFFCDCKFRFHTECYKEWLIKSRSRKCMVCFKDYTEETIIDFLANLRDKDQTISQSYDIVPYDSEGEHSDDIDDDNRIVRQSSCLLHMPGLLIIMLAIFLLMIIILIVASI